MTTSTVTARIKGDPQNYVEGKIKHILRHRRLFSKIDTNNHVGRFVNPRKTLKTYFLTRQTLLTWMRRCRLALSFSPLLLNYSIDWLTN